MALRTDVKLTTGQTVRADDEYIRNSILNPSSQIVEGYQPIMPTFKGQVTEEQLVSLVAYIKSLSGNTSTSSSSSTSGTTGSSSSGNMMQGSGTNSNNLVAPRADRGDSNSQGSNPNAPPNRSEPTNRQ